MKVRMFLAFVLVGCMCAAPAWATGTQRRTPDDPTASLDATLNDLTTRLVALEKTVARLRKQLRNHGHDLRPIDPPVEPPVEPPVRPPVDPPVRPPVDPPVKPPVDPPGTGEWPSSPVVNLLYDTRAGPPVEIVVRPGEWEGREGRRFSKVGNTIEKTQFIVWFEQVDGVDATRVTVGAINGLYDAGPSYFEQYRVKVGGVALDDIQGRHVIPPRYALFRRTYAGPEAAQLANWTYLPTDEALPGWAAASARQDTAKRVAFPYRNHGGIPVDIGPYNFFWPDHDLGDSHGGYGVAPFHGGPDDWLVCPEGRQNREAEMLLAFQRSIWMLDANYEPFEPFVPYWMGRTDPHEPPGYLFELDGWCPYGKELIRYEFHDHSHLSRGTAGAGAVAEFDIVGEECLGMVLTDFKTAHSLDRNHPGKNQGNILLKPLWERVELANGPGNGGDRALAHKLRLLRWCRPYFDSTDHEDMMRQWVRGLADQYGMTDGGNVPWAGNPSALTDPLTNPTNYTFHQQLVTYEIGRFGGLDDIHEAGLRFLTERPPAAFEIRDGNPTDTVFDRKHSATAAQVDKKMGYTAYGHMTHGVLLTDDNAADFLQAMSARGVNGSSQDLDCTPRHLWADE